MLLDFVLANTAPNPTSAIPLVVLMRAFWTSVGPEEAAKWPRLRVLCELVRGGYEVAADAKGTVKVVGRQLVRPGRRLGIVAGRIVRVLD